MSQRQAGYQTVQLAQFETVIPVEILKTVRARSQSRDRCDLESLLYWRANFEDELTHGTKEQARSEYAEAMMISVSTFRRKIWQIRGYGEDNLERWISAGVSFEHFERAAEYAGIAHKEPKQLLDECIALGGANGSVMTVDEMTSHALGEREHRPETYQAINLLSRLANIPQALKWTADKTARYAEWIEQGKEFFNEC